MLDSIIYLFNPDGECFAYDIASDSWSNRTFNSASGTRDLSSILYRDKVYIIGWDDSTFYKYTPSADSWTQLANSSYQAGACAMGIINDLIYFVGGNIGGATGAEYKSIIVYDITTDGWSLDSLEISSKRHWMATAEYKGGLYVVGGLDSNSYAVDIVEEIVPRGTAGIENDIRLPGEFLLMQNYPNPFNPNTIISWHLPEGSWQTFRVYDVLGREIAVLVNEYKPAGIYKLTWNAEGFPSGVYFYQIQAGDFQKPRR
jgi:hypothetical protein